MYARIIRLLRNSKHAQIICFRRDAIQNMYHIIICPLNSKLSKTWAKHNPQQRIPKRVQITCLLLLRKETQFKTCTNPRAGSRTDTGAKLLKMCIQLLSIVVYLLTTTCGIAVCILI